MGQVHPLSWFDRLVWPPALFVGVVAAFVGCCLAGHGLSSENQFRDFERFHAMIAPETLFYPTARQVQALARDRCDRNKILVLVGGSSVLNGVSQKPADLWTHRLQELLGDDYQVLNLGFRGAQAYEFGAVAAEFLSQDFPKLIFLTDVFPGAFYPEPDGLSFKYFFWDARAKGMLLPCPERDARLDEMLAAVVKLEKSKGAKVIHQMGELTAEQRRELHTEMQLDADLYFNELWNILAYTSFVTVWTPMTVESFTRARCNYSDREAGPRPVEQRFVHDPDPLPQLRAEFQSHKIPNGKGSWTVNDQSPFWGYFGHMARTSFPEPCRPRTLMVIKLASSYYREKMSPEEKDIYNQIAQATARTFERLGFSAAVIGEHYAPYDYSDLQHLTGVGGAKLAADLAPKIRELAGRLGYVKGGERCQ